jgi:hypothetical protein
MDQQNKEQLTAPDLSGTEMDREEATAKVSTARAGKTTDNYHGPLPRRSKRQLPKVANNSPTNADDYQRHAA